MYFPLFVGVLCLSLLRNALLCVHSSVAIIFKRKRKLVALLLLSYRCIVTINVLWLFLAMPWVGLHCVVVVFPDHTHLLFAIARGYFGAFKSVYFHADSFKTVPISLSSRKVLSQKCVAMRSKGLRNQM